MILKSDPRQSPYDRDRSPLPSLSHDKLCSGSQLVSYGDVLESKSVTKQVFLTAIVDQRVEPCYSDALLNLSLPERTAPSVAYDDRYLSPCQLTDSFSQSSG